MKKIIFTAMIVMFFCSDLFPQIYSTTLGGVWNDPNTWIGSVVPGAGDNVIIQGPVVHASASGYTILTEYCNNLTITENGSLRNGVYSGGFGVYPLVVSGNLINNGIVVNGSEDCIKIFLSGDLENNNVWMPYETEFQTANNHNLSLAAGKSFGSRLRNNGSPTFTALTDMLFTCDYSVDGNPYRDNFHLNGQTFNVGDHSIELRKCLINKGTLTGDFEIRGTFTVGWAEGYDIRDTLVFVGDIIVADTLTGNIYNGGYGIYKLKIIGNLRNYGVIKDDADTDEILNADDLSILITGNIVNNGIWKCNFVNLIGTTTQYITQSEERYFDSYFYDLDAGSKVQAQSNITITKDFDLNGATIEMENYSLKIDGWLYDGIINNAELHNAYLQNITSINNLIIKGTVTVDNNNLFQGSVVVDDTLQSNEYGGGSIIFTLKIDGNITNNGVIKDINSGDMLSLEVSGNIINKGEWTNYRTYQLYYLNHNLNSISCFNTGTTNCLFNGSTINGSGANSFSITSGGGVQTVAPNESYDLSIQFNPTGGDTTATLIIECNEIGTLSNIYLVGHNYNTVVDVEDGKQPVIPNEFCLYQNYPNPFNPSTKISWQSPVGSWQTLKVYDILGNEVATLVDEYKPAGIYEVEFQSSAGSRQLASGVYFYQFKAGDFIQSKKMLMIK